LILARAEANVIIHDVSEEAAAQFHEAPSGTAVAEEIAGLGFGLLLSQETFRIPNN
jgi:3-oxoacyl-[acyl-carrier protein] reductase